MEERVNTMHVDGLKQIAMVIAEPLAGIERQEQMIADFRARGYDVRTPLTLPASLLVNLRLEDKCCEELRMQKIATPAVQRPGGTIAQPTSISLLLSR